MAGGGGDMGCDDGNQILKGGNEVNSPGVRRPEAAGATVERAG
jgi:hypothetical protein